MADELDELKIRDDHLYQCYLMNDHKNKLLDSLIESMMMMKMTVEMEVDVDDDEDDNGDDFFQVETNDLFLMN